jgi:transcription elongation factor
VRWPFFRIGLACSHAGRPSPSNTILASCGETARRTTRRSQSTWRSSIDAEAARAREDGKQVTSIGWGNPDDGKTIDHEASPEPSNKH